MCLKSFLSSSICTVGSDYEEVKMSLTFDRVSGNRQCLNVTIIDDSDFERDENFFLVVQPENAEVISISIVIQNDDGKIKENQSSCSILSIHVYTAGESFPFGIQVGDRDIRSSLQSNRFQSDRAFFTSLQTPFTFYGSTEASLNVCT